MNTFLKTESNMNTKGTIVSKIMSGKAKLWCTQYSLQEEHTLRLMSITLSSKLTLPFNSLPHEHYKTVLWVISGILHSDSQSSTHCGGIRPPLKIGLWSCQLELKLYHPHDKNS